MREASEASRQFCEELRALCVKYGVQLDTEYDGCLIAYAALSEEDSRRLPPIAWFRKE